MTTVDGSAGRPALDEKTATAQARDAIKAGGLADLVSSVRTTEVRGRSHLLRTTATMRQAAGWTGPQAAQVLAAMQALPGVVDAQMPFAKPCVIRRRDGGGAL